MIKNKSLFYCVFPIVLFSLFLDIALVKIKQKQRNLEREVRLDVICLYFCLYLVLWKQIKHTLAIKKHFMNKLLTVFKRLNMIIYL